MLVKRIRIYDTYYDGEYLGYMRRETTYYYMGNILKDNVTSVFSRPFTSYTLALLRLNAGYSFDDSIGKSYSIVDEYYEYEMQM